MSAYARGTKTWGICQRCGLRFLLNELVFDGQIPWLRVCQSCHDIRHPQERPISVDDPEAVWRPSPEPGGPTAPVLSISVFSGNEIDLTWTESTCGDEILVMYLVYRSTDGGPWTLIASLPVQRDWDASILVNPLSYRDASLGNGVFDYYVVATDAVRRSATSNVVEGTETGNPTFFRLLEDGSYRLLEDGSRRLLEAAP